MPSKTPPGTAPLLAELERLTDLAESRRAAEDRATIEKLTREVTELRGAIARLRAERPVPADLRTVVSRAMVDAPI